MINKICVIGSGVMGSGIAAHIANCGYEVLLLDVADTESQDRLKKVKDNFEKAKLAKNSPFTHASNFDKIKLGTIDDNLKDLAEYDLIIEAIVEKLEVKKILFQDLEKIITNKACVIASNTSTIPLFKLKKDLSENIRKNFVIVHFFNPPRHMRLIELVSDLETDQNMLKSLNDFLTNNLGKGVVPCNDRPGFIANRAGCFFMEIFLRAAIEYKVDIEEADHICCQYFGMPKTGVFGLMDLIGLDLMKLMAKSMLDLLPQYDRFHKIYSEIEGLDQIISKGFIGNKGKGGFYRTVEVDGQKVKEVLDLQTFEYRPIKKIKNSFDSIYQIINKNTPVGKCFKKAIVELTCYAASLIPAVTSKPEDVDLAMQLGYNWKYGPFKLICMCSENLDSHLSGFQWVAKELETYGIRVPDIMKDKKYEQINFCLLDDVKPILQTIAKPRPVLLNEAFVLWEIKDKNALCVDLKSKANTLNLDVFNALNESIEIAEEQEKTLIIYNDQQNFSAGADLQFFYEYASLKNFNPISEYIKIGQKTMLKIKRSKVPVVSCVKGNALGGGFELILHSDFFTATMESYAGLVEAQFGLIPGWGGFKEMVLRSKGDKAKLEHNLKMIFTQQKTKSAQYFEELYNIKPSMTIINKDLLLINTINNLEEITKTFVKHGSSHVDVPEWQIPEGMNLEAAQMKVVETVFNMLKPDRYNEDELLNLEHDIFMTLIMEDYPLMKITKFVNT
jgi:3-hydroxyacyl-CoA dehydrogenase/enoyl-CoA hydratase/3-hydroxybutyryl-CoA epimerase